MKKKTKKGINSTKAKRRVGYNTTKSKRMLVPRKTAKIEGVIRISINGARVFVHPNDPAVIVRTAHVGDLTPITANTHPRKKDIEAAVRLIEKNREEELRALASSLL